MSYKIRFRNIGDFGVSMKTQDEILTFIRNQVPRGHFEEILTIIPQAFQKAHQAAGELVNIPKGRKRAQDRYSFLQDGLAGLSRTWSSSVTTTQPAGEFYTLMTMGNIKITAAIKPWKKTVRPAKYRLNNSRLNKFLTSPQMSLLDENSEPLSADDTLNAVIIPFSPSPHMDQSRPLDILIAVPYYSSTSHYHVWQSMSDFMAGYNEAASPTDFDGVWPKLRQRMREDEGNEADNQE
ncbi:hypothetical protein [Pseudomonas aeruginosa]|uniref:hypothetical protein n=6 Tax=Pseudomonas aeruginosa TaxID=287 RepID=UPI001373065E|nr:hypothetical protein [Pseudomonas aeruginosa]NBK54523.1 hypothetical protein [Pseudomonas aeruginosa]